MKTINSGETIESAIEVTGSFLKEKIVEECNHISKLFGEKDNDWKIDKIQQGIRDGKTAKTFEKLDVSLKDGTQKSFFFDVTWFYSKR